jgi:hypothetical protein
MYSSCFEVSVFTGVEPSVIFVLVNLSEPELEKEATATGFPVKLHNISAKVSFSPENKVDFEPFLVKDK